MTSDMCLVSELPVTRTHTPLGVPLEDELVSGILHGVKYSDDIECLPADHVQLRDLAEKAFKRAVADIKFLKTLMEKGLLS